MQYAVYSQHVVCSLRCPVECLVLSGHCALAVCIFQWEVCSDQCKVYDATCEEFSIKCVVYSVWCVGLGVK